MAKTLTVRIAHDIGKDLATRRLQDGVADLPRSDVAKYITLEQQDWNDDGLTFRVRAMGRSWDGQIRIADDHAELILPLPWYLAPFSSRIEPEVRKYGAQLFAR